MDTVNRAGATITNNPYLMNLFVPKKGKTWFQVPVYGFINGVYCKGLIDMLHQDEDGNIWPIDLKTIGRGVWNFPRAFLHQRYYIQAGLYYSLLEQAQAYPDDIEIDHPETESIREALKNGNLNELLFSSGGNRRQGHK
jgi:hypothetical protein